MLAEINMEINTDNKMLFTVFSQQKYNSCLEAVSTLSVQEMDNFQTSENV